MGYFYPSQSREASFLHFDLSQGPRDYDPCVFGDGVIPDAAAAAATVATGWRRGGVTSSGPLPGEAVPVGGLRRGWPSAALGAKVSRHFPNLRKLAGKLGALS